MSHGGFNTMASYQVALMFGNKQVKCGDQNNADIYKQPMIGKALCLTMPIGSLAASGAILGDVWTDTNMPVVDNLGEEFLDYVQTGMRISVGKNGVVTVD